MKDLILYFIGYYILIGFVVAAIRGLIKGSGHYKSIEQFLRLSFIWPLPVLVFCIDFYLYIRFVVATLTGKKFW